MWYAGGGSAPVLKICLSGACAGTVHDPGFVGNHGSTGSLPNMAFVRVVLGGLVAMLVVVVALPAVVLLDLVAGGTGLGLCPTGLGTCTTSAFAVMELLGILAVAVTLIGAGVVGCLYLLRQHTPAR